jgi:hypothetical protein
MNSSAGSGSVWTPSVRLPAPELLRVLTLPDFERADKIGEFWGYPQSRAFAELLIGSRPRSGGPLGSSSGDDWDEEPPEPVMDG